MSPPEQSTDSQSRHGDDEQTSKPNVEITEPDTPGVERPPGDELTHGDKANGADEKTTESPSSELLSFEETKPVDSEEKPQLLPERPSTPPNKGDQLERDSEAAVTAEPSDRKPSTGSQFLAPEPSSYVDPTPPTPTTSQPPSRTPSNAARSHHSDDRSPAVSEAGYDEKKFTSEDEGEGGSRSEIQSIMEQFSEAGGPGAEEVMSPRLELTSPIFGGPPPELPQRPQHPPRKSSLEPLSTSLSGQLAGLQVGQPQGVEGTGEKASMAEEEAPPVPPKDGSFGTPPRNKEERSSNIQSPTSPQMSVHRPPPPEPEPEPALPFDFHRFLEQLRNKKADPVARYLKSFLQEFGKKQWMVHEQVKIIGDFLAFIANKMVQCEVWRDVSDAEFDNAREGMEKLVMNRLYSQTFSPAIPSPKPIPGAKSKRKGADPPLGPGRRGQHQEDVERDDILAQKINIYGWVREAHLDIPAIEDSGKRFLKLAQQGESASCTRRLRKG